MSFRPDTYLLYGSTDVGKTSQLGEIAQWEFQRSGGVSRLISADSGWDPVEDMVSSPERPLGTEYIDLAGQKRHVCIEAWNIQSLQDPWTVFVELSEGAWPAVQLGDSRPMLKMIRPTWKDGKLWTQDGKFPVTQYFNEGLSTFGSVGLQDHQRTARKLSQDVVGTFNSSVVEIVNGKETTRTNSFSAAAPSHYGQVQRFLLEDLVPRFGKLNVARVVWTAHEGKGTDDITGIQNSELGPATVGKAAVGRTTLKFGHSFHLTINTGFSGDKNNPKVIRDFRAWFVSHPDEILTKMQWPAKVSLPIAKSAKLLERFPGGYIPLTGKSMVQYLEFLHGTEQEKK